MPRRKAKADQFYFSRCEIEDEFEKLFERTNFCKQCRKCIHCRRAEFVDFEVHRKIIYTSNKYVKNWKIPWQGRTNRLVISPVFQRCLNCYINYFS